MDKPTKVYPVPLMYNYDEAKKYIDKKLGRDIDNFYNHKYDGNNTVPLKSFWHWLTDNNFIACNGCIIAFYFDEIFDEYTAYEPWVSDVLNAFDNEFSEVDQAGNRYAEFWVEW